MISGRKSLGILLGALGILMVGAAVARGQSSEVHDRVNVPAPLAGETYLGPHVGYSFIGKFEDIYCPCDTDQNDFLFLGGRVGHFFTDHFALELTGQYFNPDRARIHDFWELTFGGMYDFTPSIPGWNTYLGFGGGASRQRVFKGKGVALAYLAFGSEYRFSKLVGLRLEVKGNYNFSARHTESNAFISFPVDTPSHVDIQPNIGVLIHFGGHAGARVVEVAPAPEIQPPPPPAPAPPPPPPERPAAPPVVAAPPPSPVPMRDMIDFDHGKARVTNIAKAKLDAVALRLRDNPRATVTITGYPDTGAGPRQERLARERAENVKAYLMERHGIDASRITTTIDMTDTENRTRAVLVTITP